MAKSFPNTGATVGLAADRTAMTSMFTGQEFFETDTKKLYLYNGTVWVESKNYSLSYRPYFYVTLHAGASVAAVNKILWNSVQVNNGSCWSAANNRFTAPIAGDYYFSHYLLAATGAVCYGRLYVNGTAVSDNTFPPGYITGTTAYMTASASGILTLNAADYVELWVASGTLHGYHNGFSGYLLS